MEIVNKDGIDYRKYIIPESANLLGYVNSMFLIPRELDGLGIPTWYLQMVRNPITKKFQPAYSLYRADKYTEEDILSNPKLKTIVAVCGMCDTANEMEKKLNINFDSVASNKSLVPQVQTLTQPQTQPRTQVNTGQIPDQMINVTPRYYDAGRIITPSFLATAIDVGSKVFCEPLGEAMLKIGFAALASMAAGLASDSGLQDAYRQMSEDLVSTYKVCPADVPAIQQNIIAIRNAMDKDKKGLVGAMASGTLKSFGKIAKEHGMEFAASAQLKGQVKVAPLQRGSGYAID